MSVGSVVGTFHRTRFMVGVPVVFFPHRREPVSTGQRHRLLNRGVNIIVYFNYIIFVIFVIFVKFLIGRCFLFLILDKVICPYLVKQFDMMIWHPTDEMMLDALMNAQVDM